MESSSSQMKKELELCVLILKVHHDLLIGYDTSQMCLVQLKRESFKDSLIRAWDTVHFVSAGVENGVTLINADTQIRIVTPPANDVKITSGIPTIECIVAFSGDPQHVSYNKSVAVSDRFGYIEIPDDEKARDYYEEQTKYRVEITVAQYTSNRKPVFKAVSDLIKINITSDDGFFEAIRKFENRMNQETRRNHLGSTTAPRGSSREEREFVPLRNAPLPLTDFSKMDLSKKVQGLLLEKHKLHQRSYGTVWTLYGDIPLKVAAVLDGNDFQSMPENEIMIGEWVDVRLEYRNGRIGVKKFVQRSHTTTNARPRRVENRGFIDYFLVDKLSLRDSDLLFEIDGLRYIHHSWLGTVEVGPPIYSRNVQDMSIRVEFMKVRNPKAVEGHHIYWVANKIADKNDQEDPRNGASSHSSESTGKTEMNGARDEGNGFRATQIPQSRHDSMVGSIGDGYRQPYHSVLPYSVPMQRPSAPPSYVHRPSSRIPMSQRSQFNDEPVRTIAIITAINRDYFVAYLQNNHMAALICDDLMDNRSLQLGTVIECDVSFRNEDEQTKGIHYEVWSISAIVGGKHFVRVIGDRTEMLVHVDVCNVNPKLNSHVDFGGQPVLCSNDVSYVLVSDRVVTPTGDTIGKNALVEKYRGNRRAENMTGFAKYSMTKVPRILLDDNYEGDEMVDSYMWQLVELKGHASQYEREQQEMESDNLGNQREQFFEDDDIARQKLRNKRQAELQARSEYGSTASSRQGTSQSFYSAREMPQYETQNGQSTSQAAPSARYSSGNRPGSEAAELRELLERVYNFAMSSTEGARIVLFNNHINERMSRKDFDVFENMAKDGEKIMKEVEGKLNK